MLKIFIIICVVIYVISLIEIIGSWILTKIKIGLSRATEFMIIPIIIPIFAPFAAFTIYSEAKELYDKKKGNWKIYDYSESFFGYIAHGFKSIDEWTIMKTKNAN